ncbi:hypothetical protein FA15DRAFT_754944 [Coprinopsis marcescibilis]|uniref:Uncharacterized protein n=1 Tax=Coprinopsis marcescibilis TaxID=230819 RepID=A0A5C3L1R3_COPMA|nr:hypothetical protein FA15DRAFT_754944 [Coprinopsis marcescibilis]
MTTHSSSPDDGWNKSSPLKDYNFRATVRNRLDRVASAPIPFALGMSRDEERNAGSGSIGSSSRKPLRANLRSPPRRRTVNQLIQIADSFLFPEVIVDSIAFISDENLAIFQDILNKGESALEELEIGSEISSYTEEELSLLDAMMNRNPDVVSIDKAEEARASKGKAKATVDPEEDEDEPEEEADWSDEKTQVANEENPSVFNEEEETISIPLNPVLSCGAPTPKIREISMIPESPWHGLNRDIESAKRYSSVEMDSPMKESPAGIVTREFGGPTDRFTRYNSRATPNAPNVVMQSPSPAYRNASACSTAPNPSVKLRNASPLERVAIANHRSQVKHQSTLNVFSAGETQSVSAQPTQPHMGASMEQMRGLEDRRENNDTSPQDDVVFSLDDLVIGGHGQTGDAIAVMEKRQSNEGHETEGSTVNLCLPNSVHGQNLSVGCRPTSTFATDEQQSQANNRKRQRYDSHTDYEEAVRAMRRRTDAEPGADNAGRRQTWVPARVQAPLPPPRRKSDRDPALGKRKHGVFGMVASLVEKMHDNMKLFRN